MQRRFVDVVRSTV